MNSTILSTLIFQIILLGLLTFTISCNENSFSNVIEVDIPPHMPQIVISAYFSSTARVQTAQLSWSRGILDTETEAILGAQVSLWHRGESVAEFVDRRSNGFYRGVGPHFLPGEEYILEVKHFDRIVHSRVIYPSQPNVESIQFKPNAQLSSDGTRLHELSFQINDKREEENYYAIEYWRISEHSWLDGDSTYTIQDTNLTYLMSLDPLLSEGNTLTLSDQTFNGQSYVVRIQMYPESTNIGKGILKASGIPKDYFFFLRALTQFNEADGNPFAEPVVLPSNIENGLGYFTINHDALFFVE